MSVHITDLKKIMKLVKRTRDKLNELKSIETDLDDCLKDWDHLIYLEEPVKRRPGKKPGGMSEQARLEESDSLADYDDIN